ncbi:MAG: PEGA domain-containing protein [Deltaproteobacteria bacterium]|nr:PEGA domain-containing protein [Deltaproteobacteria bacterium]
MWRQYFIIRYTTYLLFFLCFPPLAKAQSGDDDTETQPMPEASPDTARALSRHHFESGIALLNQSSFKEAELEFRKSISLYPTRSAWFNLANCYEAMENYPEALRALTHLKDEYANTLDDEMRGAVERNIHDAKQKVATLEIVVVQKDAQIQIDDNVIGKSPLAAPWYLKTGSYTISITCDGFEPWQSTTTLVAGQSEKLVVSLDESEAMATENTPSAESPVAPGIESPAPEQPQKDAETALITPESDTTLSPSAQRRKPLPKAPFFIALGATAAFGATTLILDRVLAGKKDNLKDTHSDSGVESAQTLQTMGKVSLVLTGVGAVTTGIIALFTQFKSAKETQSRFVPVLQLESHGAHIGLKGHF